MADLRADPWLFYMLITIHGHIHESSQLTGKDTVRIGRTTVHQPGQERFMERLVYSIVDIEGNTVLVERRTESL